MNQRIRLLAEQAGFYYTDRTGFITPAGCNPAKFAELIVRECADIVASRPYIDDGNWSHPSTMIKQHFGVQE